MRQTLVLSLALLQLHPCWLPSKQFLAHLQQLLLLVVVARMPQQPQLQPLQAVPSVAQAILTLAQSAVPWLLLVKLQQLRPRMQKTLQ